LYTIVGVFEDSFCSFLRNAVSNHFFRSLVNVALDVNANGRQTFVSFLTVRLLKAGGRTSDATRRTDQKSFAEKPIVSRTCRNRLADTAPRHTSQLKLISWIKLRTRPPARRVAAAGPHRVVFARPYEAGLESSRARYNTSARPARTHTPVTSRAPINYTRRARRPFSRRSVQLVRPPVRLRRVACAGLPAERCLFRLFFFFPRASPTTFLGNRLRVCSEEPPSFVQTRNT